MRVRLETGRTHQIRAHFAAIGHPLAGDREYGGPRVPGLERQFLHSARLALDLPWSGERHEWRSELPADLRAALEAARKEVGPLKVAIRRQKVPRRWVEPPDPVEIPV